MTYLTALSQHLHGLRKTTNTCKDDSWSLGHDLKMGFPEYEPEVLTIQQSCVI